MEAKTNNRMRGGLLATLLGVATFGCKGTESKGWLNVQPAYKLDSKSSTVRLEGGNNFGNRVNLYSFVDFYAPENSTDLDTFYGEARIDYSLGGLSSKLDGLSLATEYNGGSDNEDLVRVGVKYDTSLLAGNYLSLRAFPFETSGENGPKLGLFTTQQITDRISAQLLVNNYTDINKFYVEGELDFRVGDTANLFVQGRSFGEFDEELFKNATPVIGIKLTF
ncbi:MAG: hypothetical protein AABX23_02265 [Nanoarchaeota archaeon]